MARPPAASISAAVSASEPGLASRPGSAVRPTSATAAPSAASRHAIAGADAPARAGDDRDPAGARVAPRPQAGTAAPSAPAVANWLARTARIWHARDHYGCPALRPPPARSRPARPAGRDARAGQQGVEPGPHAGARAGRLGPGARCGPWSRRSSTGSSCRPRSSPRRCDRVEASLTRQKFGTYQSLVLPPAAVKWPASDRVTLPTAAGKRTVRVYMDPTRGGLRPAARRASRPRWCSATASSTSSTPATDRATSEPAPPGPPRPVDLERGRPLAGPGRPAALGARASARPRPSPRRWRRRAPAGTTIDRIWTSPLARARRTAEIVGGAARARRSRSTPGSQERRRGGVDRADPGRDRGGVARLPGRAPPAAGLRARRARSWSGPSRRWTRSRPAAGGRDRCWWSPTAGVIRARRAPPRRPRASRSPNLGGRELRPGRRRPRARRPAPARRPRRRRGHHPPPDLSGAPDRRRPPTRRRAVGPAQIS